jgi:hypothetical protein
LTSALVEGEWTSRPGRFTPRERTPGTHWIGGWVNPRAGLDDVEKRKFLTLPGLELQPLSRPACSQSLYRLRYPGSTIRLSGFKNAYPYLYAYTPVRCLRVCPISAMSFAIQLKFLYILSLLTVLTILFLFPLLDFLADCPPTFIALQRNNFFQFLRCFIVIMCVLPFFLYLTCAIYTFLHISSLLKWS